MSLDGLIVKELCEQVYDHVFCRAILNVNTAFIDLLSSEIMSYINEFSLWVIGLNIFQEYCFLVILK